MTWDRHFEMMARINRGERPAKYFHYIRPNNPSNWKQCPSCGVWWPKTYRFIKQKCRLRRCQGK
jgi:hypothetical protein